MQSIKGIYEYHVLCLPCHFKMGLSLMEDAQFDSVDSSTQSLQGEYHEYNMYCHVSYFSPFGFYISWDYISLKKEKWYWYLNKLFSNELYSS